MQTWRRFWRMSGYARGKVLEAASGLLMTRAGLLVAGFRRCKNAIEWMTHGTGGCDSAAQREAEFAHAMVRSVDAAARYLPLETNCLDRAITLWWMLRRRGLPAELRIGARKERERFEAHAWVELGGAILDPAAARIGNFNVFARSIPAARARAL